MTNIHRANDLSMFLDNKKENYGSLSSTDASIDPPVYPISKIKNMSEEEDFSPEESTHYYTSGISLIYLMDENTVMSEPQTESYLIPIKSNDKSGDDASTVYSESSYISEVSAWLPLEEETEVPKPQYNNVVSSDPQKRIFLNEENEEEVPFYLRILGFHDNPLAESPDLRLALLSNFSTSYNVVNISIALSILGERQVGNQSFCSSALIAGMVLGQLSGGAIGDALGRHLAMTIMMILQIISSIGSACSFGFYTLQMLSLWRFLLGIGCGGVYPLAATLTAESTKQQSQRGKLVALTFSMQGVGYLFVPLIGYFLILVLGDESDLAWRILLGIGCIPGVVLMLFRLRQRRNAGTILNECRASSQISKDNGVINRILINKNLSFNSVWAAIQKEKCLFRKLMGTAMTWYLFDILFYGNTLFERVVLISAFGDSEYTARSICRDSFLISTIALPGYFVSIRNVGNKGTTPRYIQIQGFFIMAILFFFIGVMFDRLAKMPCLLLLLYGSTFFFANYGPNATTFMLPSMTFSVNCRSTLNGICAASGKLGALLGAFLFKPASEFFGDDVVMLFCSGISIAGLLLTWICVDSSVGQGKDGLISTYSSLVKPSNTKGEKKKRRIKKSMTNTRFSSPSLIDFWIDEDTSE